MQTQSDNEEGYATSDYENDSEDFEKDGATEEELDTRQHSDDGTYLQSGGVDLSSGVRFDDTDSSPPVDLLQYLENISYTDPEVMLTKLLNINLDVDFNIARITKIKCLALCKIIYGETHWRVAEAHVQLANVYLKGKHYPQQILKHTNIARDILLSCSKGDDDSKREYLLQNLYYLMGRVNFQLSNYKVSENHLMKAKLVSDHTRNATSRYLTMKINILSSLASTLSKLSQFGQAIEYLEEAIEIAGKMSGSDKYLAINLHKQIVTMELTHGKDANLSFANESAEKALELSVSFNGHDSAATAEILVLMSRINILKDVPDYEKIEAQLREALAIYTKLENNTKAIQTQEMICKVFMKQERFSVAKSVLKEAITVCESTYGDMSLRSAELYELMGNILFAENKMANALKYLSKAEEPLVGRKRYHQKQIKISKLIEIIKKSQLKTSELNKKEKPRFN